MRASWLASLCFPCVHSQAESFVLPPAFEGLWQGVPEFNIMGPWSNSLTFAITKASNGDYVFQDMIDYDGRTGWAWQRFYVEGSGATAGNLWYCNGFSNAPGGGAGARTTNSTTDLFKAVREPTPTDRSVTFCMASSAKRMVWPLTSLGCRGCDCANWTLTVDEEAGVLESSLMMGGAPGHTHSKHLLVRMTRRGAPPAINFPVPAHGNDFSCDFEGRDSHPIDFSPCPFAKQMMSYRWDRRELAKSYVSSFEHCYVVNELTGFILEWEIDHATSQVQIQASAAASFGDSSYIAIGFRPYAVGPMSSEFPETGIENMFGMSGADIVAGVKTGVKTMYAKLYTGPPEDADYLQITDSEVEFVDGRITMRFTRPLVSGRLAQLGLNMSMVFQGNDILWATGSAARGELNYHGHTRGMHPQVDWEKPDDSMQSHPQKNPWVFPVEARCGYSRIIMM